MCDDLLGVVAKIASIITGVVASIFLISDRLKRVKITINFDIAMTEKLSDGQGGFELLPENGFRGKIINNTNSKIVIDSINFLIDGKIIDLSPIFLTDTNSRSSLSYEKYLTLEHGHRHIFFFPRDSITPIIEKEFNRAHFFRVKIVLQNKKILKSNIIYMKAKAMFSS